MTTIHILDNKKSRVNRMSWGNQACSCLPDYYDVINHVNLVIGESSKQEMMTWIETLQPLDIVITDGNKKNGDTIDPVFLNCLLHEENKKHLTNVYIILLSADEDRVKIFEAEIKAVKDKLPSNLNLFTAESNQLIKCFRENILPIITIAANQSPVIPTKKPLELANVQNSSDKIIDTDELVTSAKIADKSQSNKRKQQDDSNSLSDSKESSPQKKNKLMQSTIAIRLLKPTRPVEAAHKDNLSRSPSPIRSPAC